MLLPLLFLASIEDASPTWLTYVIAAVTLGALVGGGLLGRRWALRRRRRPSVPPGPPGRDASLVPTPPG